MARIDPADWAEEHLEGVRKRGASIEATCPFCGKAGHLYLHREEGYFTCFAKNCGQSGRDLTRLIAQVEGVTMAEARRRMFRGLVEFKRRRPEGTATFADRMRELREGKKLEPVDVAPPPGMTQVWDGKRWKMPTYLLERGVSRRLARRFGLGFCGPGLCSSAPEGCVFPEEAKLCTEIGRCRYANRIVLPYSCPGGRSFNTRATEKDQEPKYLNPPAPKGRLLYGWQNAVEGGELVVVEGPFDVLRLVVHGIAAVAVMGLVLGPAQLRLLSQLRLASATVMLDAGVETEAQALASSLLGAVGEVFVARLPGKADPGEATREQAWEALRTARPHRAGRTDRAAGLRSRLSGLF